MTLERFKTRSAARKAAQKRGYTLDEITFVLLKTGEYRYVVKKLRNG